MIPSCFRRRYYDSKLLPEDVLSCISPPPPQVFLRESHRFSHKSAEIQEYNPQSSKVCLSATCQFCRDHSGRCGGHSQSSSHTLSLRALPSRFCTIHLPLLATTSIVRTSKVVVVEQVPFYQQSSFTAVMQTVCRRQCQRWFHHAREELLMCHRLPKAHQFYMYIIHVCGRNRFANEATCID